MKKLAILLATLLCVCVMATACGGKDDPKSEAPASQTATATKTASNTAAPASNSTVTPSNSTVTPSNTTVTPSNTAAPTSQAPAVTGSLFDFSADCTVKGEVVANKVYGGVFTVVNGKVTTSSGKSAKDGSCKAHSFLGGIQLGTNGSATDKCITFTATSTGNIEIYANYGSSTATSGNLTIQKVGGTAEVKIVAKDIYVTTVAVEANAQYALYVADAVSSVNVWGIVL